MPTINVVTCGTSLLRNGIPREDKELNAVFNATANKNYSHYTPDEKTQIDALIARQREKLMSADENGQKKISAELKGLIAYYRSNSPQNGGFDAWKKDTTVLICTDTYQGRQVAALLHEWGTSHGLNMSELAVDDLNTAQMAAFHSGINHLVKWCHDTLPGYRQSGYHIVFNLVGGFKSLQGYMQTLGMFYADEIVYIFEMSDELLRIPMLPIDLIDLTESTKNAIRDNLPLVRYLANRTLNSKVRPHLPDALLDVLGDDYELSMWGKMMFDHFKKELYQERLLEPWIENIVFTDKAKNSVRGLEAQRYVILNAQIDDLCNYMLSGRSKNPDSLNVHSIVGTNPGFPPESKFMFYAWSDGKAWRGYCHFKDDTLIVDDFGPHVKK